MIMFLPKPGQSFVTCLRRSHRLTPRISVRNRPRPRSWSPRSLCSSTRSRCCRIPWLPSGGPCALKSFRTMCLMASIMSMIPLLRSSWLAHDFYECLLSMEQRVDGRLSLAINSPSTHIAKFEGRPSRPSTPALLWLTARTHLRLGPPILPSQRVEMAQLPRAGALMELVMLVLAGDVVQRPSASFCD
jgi:hypothetical protein